MGKKARLVQVPIAGFKAAVHFHEGHRGALATLVCLHGFSGSGEDFLPLRKALGGDCFHWACVDFMGHGQSDCPDTLDPYLLQNTLQLLDSARSLAPDPGKVFLIGYSMGARVAMHYLRCAKPLPAALIGVSPGIEDPTERRLRRLSDASWIRPRTRISDFCDRWEAQPLIHPQTQLPEPLNSDLALRRRKNRIPGLHNTLLALGSGVLPSLWEELSVLPPALCLYGECDDKYAMMAGLMESKNETLRALGIPGCGHAPHLEAPDKVATRLTEFLLSR